MKKFLFVSLTAFVLSACCKEVCEDQELLVNIQNMQAVDTDTVYLIKYKPNTSFNEEVDSLKRFTNVPAGSTLPSTFSQMLEFNYDWKIVIPALNKEYFISGIEVQKERCHCTGDDYKSVKKFRFNNIEIEGSRVDLN